jgi:hypothetical protein
VSIESSYGGLETTHIWLPGLFTLNDLTLEPRVRLTRITGLHSLSEIDDARETGVGQAGERVIPVERRGRTIVYEGLIQSRTLFGLRALSRDMRGAFRGRSDEGVMRIVGDPDWEFEARVMQLDMDDEQEHGPQHVRTWQRKFTIGLRLGDPRVYALDEVLSDGHAAGSTISVTNDGITDTDPIFEVTIAEGQSLILRNDDIDGDPQLIFRDLPAGTLRVDFKTRRAVNDDDGDVTEVSGKLDTEDSTWWDEGTPGLLPGVNHVYSSRGPWSVAFRHADE